MRLEEIAHAGFHRVVVARDPDAQYVGVIAIHDVSRGPALGGTRLLPYPSEAHAIADALRLAEAMTLKSNFAGLPFGGGKATIVEPSGAYDRAALLRAHGRAVEALGGEYITGEDVGTTPQDFPFMRAETTYVLPITDQSIDSAWATARGVFRAIQGAVAFVWSTDDLSARDVVVQGCGATGKELIRDLVRRGATVRAADVVDAKAADCAALGARIVRPEDAPRESCEIFAPCALGGTLTTHVAAATTARVVAGSANNQLSQPGVADVLHGRGVLWVPDFVANAGGVIAAAPDLIGWSRERTLECIDAIQAAVFALAVESARAGESLLSCALRRARHPG